MVRVRIKVLTRVSIGIRVRVSIKVRVMVNYYRPACAIWSCLAGGWCRWRPLLI